MGVFIHPQAIVSRKALLSEGVKIGPFTLIEDNVRIGRNTQIGSHCLVSGYTSIGENCQIFKGAVLGSPPQDLKYKGARSFIEIGDGNIIREFVTINPGTEESSVTSVGDNNLIMAYSHIAHNCKIGNNTILANGATLAGYVEIQDRAVIGGLVAIHQFCRIGSFSIVGGCSKVVQDVPPYSLCDGHPARIYGLNFVGLKRGGFSKEVLQILKKAFKILFFERRNLKEAIEMVRKTLPQTSEVDTLLKFIQTSQRGISK